MAVSIPADVNPALLKWARDQSGYSLRELAKAIGVSDDRIQAWEQGERRPTVRQIQTLAKRLRRPFGVFFLPQPPVVAALATEYRRLPSVHPGDETPEFRMAVRVMLQRRDVAAELLEELGQRMPEFGIRAALSESATTVGQRIRAALGIPVERQLAWHDEWEAWRAWRGAVENVGVLVFQFPKVSLEQARGVLLPRVALPVIGINAKESAPGARAFSLLHELVHLSLALSKEERTALLDTRPDVEWADVERFADEAAGEALVPTDAVRKMALRGRPPDGWDGGSVRSLAARFRVTPAAMAVRLQTAGLMSWDEYRRWRSAWDAYVATLKPRHGGPTTPAEKALSRGGRPYAQLVLEAFDLGRITAVDASRHLDLRFDHVDSLRHELRRPTRSSVDTAGEV